MVVMDSGGDMMRVLKAITLVAVIAALALLTLAVAPLPSLPDSGLKGDFLVRNIHVLDVHKGEMEGPRNILIRDGIIASITAAGTAAQDTGPKVIDANGKYAIPGLWDMHTHSTKLAPHYLHPLFLANGVTSVREMWGCMSQPDSYIACQDDRQRWNQALDNGSAQSPRYLTHSSFQINGGNEVPQGYPEFFKARTPQEARQLVTYYAQSGADFLKTYSELSAVAYNALADEAGKQGLSLAGHRPLAVSLPELLLAGQRSIEHPRLFLFECYRGARKFRALQEPLSAYTMDLRRQLVTEHDAATCAELMSAMAASKTAWVPTLQVLGMSARSVDAEFRADSRLKYIPWTIRMGMWTPDINNAVRKAQQRGHHDTFQQLYRLAQEHVRGAHASGVELLLGTDAGDTYIFPGFSVHDELAEFVAAGIPAADAIKIATLEAARFSGFEHRYGSIEEGKVADLILLNKNPLEDISATRSIHALLFNGTLLTRPALDQLLGLVESRSSSIQFNLKLLWSGLGSPIVRVQFAD